MRKLIIYILSLMLFLSGCTKSSKKPDQAATPFDEWAQSLFVDLMSENYVDCHFTLKNPEAYGITFDKIDFGQLIEDDDDDEKALKALKSFKRDELTETQQLVYDVMLQSLNNSIAIDDDKYDYIYNVCDPLSSETSNLSTVLIEFPFYKEQDIVDYITLLNSTKAYTDQINDYLNKQSKKGLFMPSSVADDYIKTLDSFMDKNNNPLVRMFDHYEFSFELSDEAKASYREDIKKAYDDVVYEAFKSVKTTVKKLKSTSKNDKGLYYYKNGKQFYQAYVQSQLGTSMTIKQIEKLMSNRLSSLEKAISKLYVSHMTDVLDYSNDMKTNFTSYEAILSYLEETMVKDFPSIGKIKYKVTDMDESNAKSGNSAYYIVPPIDDEADNMIRVNTTSSKVDVSSVDTFINLAHEGYPGHLYQTNYAFKKDLPDLLKAVSCTGYTEGYATLVQYKAYDYLPDYKDALKQIMRLDEQYTYALIILCDIGIHYKGWGLSQIKNYLGKFGYEAAASEVYNQLLGSPGIFMSYHVGCALFEKYQSDMKKTLGSKYTDQIYYEAILNYGSVPMDVLEKRLKDFAKSYK